MRKITIGFAALLLGIGTGALASQDSQKQAADQALSRATSAMTSESNGARDTAVFGMAYEWGAPSTEGGKGAILAQMGVNHTFGRRLTTGDFREDLLVGFDSKANMRFAVMHGGIGDSCPVLAAKKFTLKIESRAGSISMDGGEPRAYEAGKTKGCFVQIVANSSKLRDLLNQSKGSSLFFTLIVDGTDRPVFFKAAGATAAFRQTAEVMIARQNFSIVNKQ
ncbi:MAG: hypothetical protein WAT93_12205 [Pontixanthobacter sp.]